MDIYSYIKRDHRKVATMMDDVLTIRLANIRQNIFLKIKAELTAHAMAEEQTFYAALLNGAPDTMNEQMGHAVHDHREITDILDKLDGTPIASEMWIETFGELKQAVTHHVEEEENVVFAKARSILNPAQARQMAKDMDELKQQLLTDLEFDIPAI